MASPLDGQRVQAEDTPDAAPLQTNDWSGLSFYAAPAHAPENDDLGRLAQSLGSFSEDVRQFGHAYSMAQRVHPAVQEKSDSDAARAFRDTHTDPELIAAEKAGTVPRFQSPIAQEYMNTSLGQAHATAMFNDVQQKVGTGELKWSDGSAQQYMQQQRQQYTQGLAPNSGQATGYGAAFNHYADYAQRQVQQQQVQDTNAAAQQTASDQVEMALQNAFTQKLSPEQTVQNLNAVRISLVHGLHFEPKEIDPIIFNGLQRRMSGPGADPNWVMAVGNALPSDTRREAAP